MKIESTNFSLAKVITHEVHEDNRGFFKEIYSSKDHIGNGLCTNWAQDAISVTEYRNTIRGLHMQPNMAKLVTVSSGKVYDVIVDLNTESETYGEWEGFYLSAENHKQLLVPAGFAHGFLSLTDNVVFHYKMSQLHDKTTEQAFRYNSEVLGIRWPLMDNHVIISEKDNCAKEFRLSEHK